MAGSEADRWQTRVDAGERVMMVGYVEFAFVLGGIVVRVAD